MKNNIIVVEERSIIKEIESLAKTKISVVIARKAELKEKKEEFETMLLENEEYAQAVAREKLAKDAKKDAKTKAIEEHGTPALELMDDIKTMSKEVKDNQISLFDYLLELNKKDGRTEITDNTGERHDIQITASIKI